MTRSVQLYIAEYLQKSTYGIMCTEPDSRITD